MAPEKYEEIMETVENYYLYMEAEKRINADNKEFLSQEQLLKELNIKEEEISDIEVEIE